MTAWGWLKLLLMDFECSALSLPPVLEPSHPISKSILCLQLAVSCSPVYQLTHNQVESYLNLGTAPLTSWVWSIPVQAPLSECSHTCGREQDTATPRAWPGGEAFRAALLGMWAPAPRRAGACPPLLQLFCASKSCKPWFMRSAERFFCWKQLHRRPIGEPSWMRWSVRKNSMPFLSLSFLWSRTIGSPAVRLLGSLAGISMHQLEQNQAWPPKVSHSKRRGVLTGQGKLQGYLGREGPAAATVRQKSRSEGKLLAIKHVQCQAGNQSTGQH